MIVQAGPAKRKSATEPGPDLSNSQQKKKKKPNKKTVSTIARYGSDTSLRVVSSRFLRLLRLIQPEDGSEDSDRDGASDASEPVSSKDDGSKEYDFPDDAD